MKLHQACTNIPLEVVLLAVRHLVHLLLGQFDLHLVTAHLGWCRLRMNIKGKWEIIQSQDRVTFFKSSGRTLSKQSQDNGLRKKKTQKDPGRQKKRTDGGTLFFWRRHWDFSSSTPPASLSQSQAANWVELAVETHRCGESSLPKTYFELKWSDLRLYKLKTKFRIIWYHTEDSELSFHVVKPLMHTVWWMHSTIKPYMLFLSWQGRNHRDGHRDENIHAINHIL